MQRWRIRQRSANGTRGDLRGRGARELLGDKEKRILVLAGPGNNGGDALVAARHLKQWWLDVTVVFTGVASKLPEDAKAALAEWKAASGVVHETIPAGGHWHLVVDGLFGVGLERPLEGRYAELVKLINAAGSRVLAIDIPSGLHADSGRVLGCAVRAHHTLTFIGLKPGLLTLDGPDHTGEVHLDTLGVAIPGKAGPAGRRIESALLGSILRPRPRNSHKGMYGNVGISVARREWSAPRCWRAVRRSGSAPAAYTSACLPIRRPWISISRSSCCGRRRTC